MKPKFVDQVDITIPLNQADGDVPNLKNYKIGEIKKFFSVSVNNEKLKELRVTHYKISNLGLSVVKVEDGVVVSFPESIKVTLYGTESFVSFKLVDLGSCFSLKFYNETAWGGLNPYHIDDYAGKTNGIRKFSNKSYDDFLDFINKSVENGTVFVV